jgi:hypothetical protein
LELWKRSDVGSPEFVDERRCPPEVPVVVQGGAALPPSQAQLLADRLSDCRREALGLIYETIAGANPPV